MPIFKNFGKPKDTIANYLKPIEQYYIPSLNNLFDVMIDTSPVLTRETYVVYEDSDIGLKVEISSNHRDITEEGDLFVSVSYDNMKNDVGIINFKNKASLEDAVDMTLNALHEIGFKTGEEKEAEKQKEYEKQQEEKNKKDEEERKRKERWSKDNTENEYADEPYNTEEDTVEDSREYEENKPEFINELDKSLQFVSDLKGEGQTITVEWVTLVSSKSSTTQQFGHIYAILTHITGNNYLLENKRINPKVEKVVNSEKAKEYIEKVSDKVEQVGTIMIKDENGKDLKVPSEYTGDPLDLDIDI